MSEYLIQSETLDEIADAINAKTGGSSAMTPAEMVTAIGSIETGGADRLKTAEVTLTQDYATLGSTPASVMALCASAIGTANYAVIIKSTAQTDATNLSALFYAGVNMPALAQAPLNKIGNGVVRTHSNGVALALQGVWGGVQYNSRAWAGDVYQVWGWD